MRFSEGIRKKDPAHDPARNGTKGIKHTVLAPSEFAHSLRRCHMRVNQIGFTVIGFMKRRVQEPGRDRLWVVFVVLLHFGGLFVVTGAWEHSVATLLRIPVLSNRATAVRYFGLNGYILHWLADHCGSTTICCNTIGIRTSCLYSLPSRPEFTTNDMPSAATTALGTTNMAPASQHAESQ